MTLLYPPSRPLFYHDGGALVAAAIGETPALGVRGARKHVGGGDGQQAREERHAEERGGERARAAGSETECGCSCEEKDHGGVGWFYGMNSITVPF